MTSLRQRMTEDMQVRNLALSTQTSYVQQVSLFARYFNKSPEVLGPEEIRAYQIYLTNEKKMAPGSVLIAVAAPHRHEAFSAARLIIDAIKADVAIWKKEIWSDGSGTWVQPQIPQPNP